MFGRWLLGVWLDLDREMGIFDWEKVLLDQKDKAIGWERKFNNPLTGPRLRKGNQSIGSLINWALSWPINHF